MKKTIKPEDITALDYMDMVDKASELKSKNKKLKRSLKKQKNFLSSIIADMNFVELVRLQIGKLKKIQKNY